MTESGFSELAAQALKRIVPEESRRDVVSRAILFKLSVDQTFPSRPSVTIPGRDLRIATIYIGVELRLLYERSAGATVWSVGIASPSAPPIE